MEEPTPEISPAEGEGAGPATSAPPPLPGRPSFRIPFPLLWLGGIFIAVLVIVLITILALRPVLFPRRPPGIPLSVTRISPSISPLPLPAPPVAEIGNAEIPLPVPTSLEMGDRSFPIQPVTVVGTAWQVPAPSGDSAFWVSGTVLPYVLGLEMTEDNLALAGGLREGDRVVLHLSSGAQAVFRVVRQRTVAPDDPTIFAQSRPGLTLVVLAEGDRLVVEADFRELLEAPPAPSGPTAGPGQPVQAGDARVTVLEAHVERGLPELPAGTVAYFVEVAVENTGSSSLSPRDFATELVDGDGNRYLPIPSLAGRGKYGPLPEEIPAGGRAEGTVAYIIPEAIAGPTLRWVFGTHVISAVRAQFSLSYTPPPVATAVAEVTVLQAFLGEGGEVLHIVARVRNGGQAPLEVTERDILLSSRAGSAELQVAAPPLPWTIAAGEAREVELQFARPQATTCVFTILGYTFEISGLP